MKRLTTDQFIERSNKTHNNKYDYSLIEKEGYKNNYTKVKIICPVHGIFEQKPNDHLQGHGCQKCGGSLRKTIEKFIEKARKIHGNKYDYSLVDYKNIKTKIKIICDIHGVFEQTPNSHLSGSKCPKCMGFYKEKYASNDIPRYDLYVNKLQPYGVECRRNKEDNNILEVKCMYCDRWYKPTLQSVKSKIQCINGNINGEYNLYCSYECKRSCPTYGQRIYPKDFKLGTSREVQPALRKLVLKRDNYTCQKCDAKDKELHCHHYEGIEINPVESADIDMCVTLCIDCHHETHSKDKCGIKDYKRKEC